MKKLAIIYTIGFILIWSPIQAIEESIRPGEPVDKLIKEKGDIQLRRCGVGFVEDKGIRKRMGSAARNHLRIERSGWIIRATINPAQAKIA